jgi:hypothetical protein
MALCYSTASPGWNPSYLSNWLWMGEGLEPPTVFTFGENPITLVATTKTVGRLDATKSYYRLLNIGGVNPAGRQIWYSPDGDPLVDGGPNVSWGGSNLGELLICSGSGFYILTHTSSPVTWSKYVNYTDMVNYCSPLLTWAYKGIWSSSTAYVVNDVVWCNGFMFIATNPSTNKYPFLNYGAGLKCWFLFSEFGGVENDNAAVGNRPVINFIPGSHISITTTDHSPLTPPNPYTPATPEYLQWEREKGGYIDVQIDYVP